MAFTPESLTEQQMQPLARSSHSETWVSPSLIVRGLVSRSDVLPNSFNMTAILWECFAVRM